MIAPRTVTHPVTRAERRLVAELALAAVRSLELEQLAEQRRADDARIAALIPSHPW